MFGFGVRVVRWWTLGGWDGDWGEGGARPRVTKAGQALSSILDAGLERRPYPSRRRGPKGSARGGILTHALQYLWDSGLYEISAENFSDLEIRSTAPTFDQGEFNVLSH